MNLKSKMIRQAVLIAVLLSVFVASSLSISAAAAPVPPQGEVQIFYYIEYGDNNYKEKPDVNRGPNFDNIKDPTKEIAGQTGNGGQMVEVIYQGDYEEVLPATGSNHLLLSALLAISGLFFVAYASTKKWEQTENQC